MSEQDQKRWA